MGVAACGGAAPSGVASIGRSRSGQSVASFDATALEYSVCMRKHGVPDFPDPTISDGGMHVSLKITSNAGVSSAVFQAAETACAKYSIAGPSGQVPAYYLKESLAAVECMRAHGFPNLPDPTTHPPSRGRPFEGTEFQTNGVTFMIPSTIDQNSLLFTRAAAACDFPPPGVQ